MGTRGPGKVRDYLPTHWIRQSGQYRIQLQLIPVRVGEGSHREAPFTSLIDSPPIVR
jgi:hypothetical protein